jgi:hypothetical protein
MATIPNIGSFDPPDTDADPDELSTQSGFLQAHSGRIIGRGTDVLDQMNTGVVEFSELVAEPLAREGRDFISAAQTAMEGAVYGSMVTNQWATWVREFKTARQALINEWAGAVGNDFGIKESEVGGTTPNLTPAERAAATAEATAYAGQLKLAELNARAATLWENFKGQARDAGSMLKGGPTPENLRALAADGVGTWLGYNVFGLDMAIPVTGADGKLLADAVLDMLRNGGELTPELRAQLESLMLLAQRAQNMQGVDDAQLTPSELAFLEAFYSGVDVRDINGGPDNFMLYNIPQHLKDIGMSGADQALFLGAMGGGLLALSNSGVGGGLDRLPDSLRRPIEYLTGASKDKGYDYADYTMYIEGLAPMLGAAADKGLDKLQAGRELSTGLMWMIADTFDHPDDQVLNHLNKLENADAHFADIMEIITRDKDLNADLLTGFVKHPDYGDDSPEHLLRGVFGRNWEDDGKSAAKLIDWIPGALTGSDPFLARDAAESYASLVNTMTNDEIKGPWKQSAFTFFTDDYGKMNGFSNAPIGMANPHIAQALASSTIPFLDWFADPEATIEVDGEKVERDTAVNWAINPEDRGAYFNMTDRARMFELIMGSKDAANVLGEAVYAKAYVDGFDLPQWANGDDQADLGLPGGGDGEGAEMYAKRTGRLIGFLQAGYDAVHADGAEDAAGVTASNKQESAWVRAGAAVAKELVLSIPGIRPTRVGWDILVKEAFEIGKWGPNVTEAHGWAFGGADAPGKGDGPMTHEKINVYFGHNIVDGLTSDPKSGRTIEELAEYDPNLVVKDSKTGDLRMRTPEEIEKAYDPVNGSDYSLDKALDSYRQFLGPGNTTRYNEYVGTLDDISEEYRERYAR